RHWMRGTRGAAGPRRARPPLLAGRNRADQPQPCRRCGGGRGGPARPRRRRHRSGSACGADGRDRRRRAAPVRTCRDGCAFRAGPCPGAARAVGAQGSVAEGGRHRPGTGDARLPGARRDPRAVAGHRGPGWRRCRGAHGRCRPWLAGGRGRAPGCAHRVGLAAAAALSRLVAPPGCGHAPEAAFPRCRPECVESRVIRRVTTRKATATRGRQGEPNESIDIPPARVHGRAGRPAGGRRSAMKMPLKSRKSRAVFNLWLLELVLICVAITVAAWLRFHGDPDTHLAFAKDAPLRTALVAICAPAAMAAFGLYQVHSRCSRMDLLLRLGMSFAFAGIALLVTYYVVPQTYIGRGVLA